MVNINWIGRFFKKVQIVCNTTLKNPFEALGELFLSLLFSMAPVLSGVLILYITNFSKNHFNLIYCFREIIRNGELFMYAATILSPVIYIVIKDRKSANAFPCKPVFIGAVFIVTLLSIIIFTIVRVTPQSLPTTIITFSIWVFFIAVVIYYIALVYNNALLPNPSKEMRFQEDSFVEKVHQHRI